MAASTIRSMALYVLMQGGEGGEGVPRGMQVREIHPHTRNGPRHKDWRQEAHW